MVFQSYALFPNMTVADNIGFGLQGPQAARRPRSRKRVAELLELIHLEGRGDRYPWQLSGGQQQRVALARALAIEPQVLLLDEPLSALDAKIRVVLRKEIRAIQRQLGITTVYVTHDQEEALSLSDRVVVMSEGRIEQIGTPSEIYNFPTTAFVASFVGHAQPGQRPASSTPARDGCRSTARRSGRRRRHRRGRERRAGHARASGPRASRSARARRARTACAARSTTSTSWARSCASGCASATGRTARRRRWSRSTRSTTRTSGCPTSARP